MNFPPPPPDEPWTLRARWVFPADAPPVPNGRVTIRAGRILHVTAEGPADLDLGNTALLPGLVNAHTHLDLGMLRGRCQPTADLPAWLRCVIEGRRAATAHQVREAIYGGIAECLRYGTTLVGDISAGGASYLALVQAPLRAVVFHEVLGLPRERAEQAWQNAQDWLRRVHPTACCRPGLSPHAPYSVRRDLFAHAAESGLPLAIHLAESQAELQLLREHTGPFADFLKDLGVWDPDGLISSPEHVLAMLRGAPDVVFAHGNYLSSDAAIAPGQSIVYCPRTHAAFGHAPYALRNLIERSVRVALGTDSLASNPDLDMLAEARFVHARHPDVPGDVLLRMLTFSGAEALAWAAETGSLTPGKSADMVVLPLPDVEPVDPHALLWESALLVRAVMFRGHWLAV